MGRRRRWVMKRRRGVLDWFWMDLLGGGGVWKVWCVCDDGLPLALDGARSSAALSAHQARWRRLTTDRARRGDGLAATLLDPFRSGAARRRTSAIG